MYCPHCGKELPEEYKHTPQENNNSDFCESNADEHSQDTVSNNQRTDDNPDCSSIEPSLPVFIPTPENRKNFKPLNKRITKVIVCLLIFAAAVCGIFIGVIQNGKSDLREKLAGSWEASNSSFPTASLLAGSSITFDKDNITYSESLGLFETTTVTVSYKITSSDTIEIKGNKYEIVFKGTNSMTITPGLTGNQSETWLKEQTYTDDQYDNSQPDGII